MQYKIESIAVVPMASIIVWLHNIDLKYTAVIARNPKQTHSTNLQYKAISKQKLFRRTSVKTIRQNLVLAISQWLIKLGPLKEDSVWK